MKHAINRTLNATSINYGLTTSATGTQTEAPNPLSGYTSAISRLLYSRMQSQLGKSATEAAATYFVGDFAKAFAYMENWPITVTQAPANSEAEFNQDIVARFKASERGVAAVWDPRFTIKVNGHA